MGSLAGKRLDSVCAETAVHTTWPGRTSNAQTAPLFITRTLARPSAETAISGLGWPLSRGPREQNPCLPEWECFWGRVHGGAETAAQRENLVPISSWACDVPGSACHRETHPIPLHAKASQVPRRQCAKCPSLWTWGPCNQPKTRSSEFQNRRSQPAACKFPVSAIFTHRPRPCFPFPGVVFPPSCRAKA